jgi:hypothetical protein
MKIATFTVHGTDGRLPRSLESPGEFQAGHRLVARTYKRVISLKADYDDP